ncbi:AAA_family ATPase [Hexamita inflata]|uniref:AAA family ATPase n=1 Tax=Hexamita inflata TaxID=28002 RepID=A0AA86TMB8_9EUKA|nr:AAA family ATPase [Hexamita inflata]
MQNIIAPDLNTVKGVNRQSFRSIPLVQQIAQPKQQAPQKQQKQPEQQGDQVSFIKDAQPVKLSNLGGITYLTPQITNLIENAILRPDCFRRYGAEPPTGVLLTGPTGVGKTVLAHAIYNHINDEFVNLNGSITSTSSTQPGQNQCVTFLQTNATDLISSKTGESEQLIKTLFEQAIQNQPSVIFIDQLDILAIKSENATREFEKRLVAQLNNQLDTVQGHRVIVLGATSKLTQLDTSLRRPGRFDVEIEILVPNRVQRCEILSKFLTSLPQSEISEIAALTPGYVPADIYQLLREASIDANIKQQPQLTIDNFKVAVKKVQPTAKREGFATIPEFSLNQIGGLEEVKRMLQMHILKPIKNPVQYQKLGLKTHTGVILYGAPGNGKSLLGRAIASQAEANFISVKGPELLNQYVGESERAVRVLFERARAARPVVLFLDECECLCRQRGSGGGNSEVTDRIVNQFLTELDGVGSDRDGVFIIAATNRIDLLDKAIMRPGRLEKAIYVPLPDQQQMADILLKQTMNCAMDQNVTLEFFQEICSKLIGYSGADLQAITREAGLCCVERDGDQISQADFQTAVTRVRRSVSEKDLEYYKTAQMKWE